MKIVTETFIIGNNPGQYPAGSYIQDSIFKGGTIDFMLWNDVPQTSGYSVADSRLYLGGTNVFNNNDVIFVQVKK